MGFADDGTDPIGSVQFIVTSFSFTYGDGSGIPPPPAMNKIVAWRAGRPVVTAAALIMLDRC